MSSAEFLSFFAKARQQENEEQLWQLYVSVAPHLQKPVSFKAWKDQVTGANVDHRSNAEILAEVAEIRKEMNEKKEKENGFRNI